MILSSPLRCAILFLGPVLLLGMSLWVQEPSALGQSAMRYAERPPLAHTGGFGEPTCQACHFGTDVNAGEGRVTVEGLPDSVRTGQTYELTVRLAAPMEGSGFMLSLRHPDGTQAGQMAPIDSGRVAVRRVDSTGVQYAHHTRAGTETTSAEQTEWAIRWTAPSAGDSVVAHVAANATNDDASEFGDEIYTTTARTAVGPSE